MHKAIVRTLFGKLYFLRYQYSIEYDIFYSYRQRFSSFNFAGENSAFCRVKPLSYGLSFMSRMWADSCRSAFVEAGYDP